MFYLTEFMGKRVLKSTLIDDGNVEAFFTTRDLFLKFGEREDLKEQFEENKKIVCDGLNIPDKNLIIPIQTHSDNVRIVKNTNEKEYNNTDGLVTDKSNIALGLNFADCVPLLFYDEQKHVIASAHAGWKGTVANIGVKTVKKMVETFSCKPENISALIGPSIGKCCFEVGEDVLDKIKNSVKGKTQNAIKGKYVDLKKINEIQLLDMGLINIDVCGYCTSCSNELFYSYRKEKGHTARHSSVIMLKK